MLAALMACEAITANRAEAAITMWHLTLEEGAAQPSP
jgi:hypothetical protein